MYRALPLMPSTVLDLWEIQGYVRSSQKLNEVRFKRASRCKAKGLGQDKEPLKVFKQE